MEQQTVEEYLAGLPDDIDYINLSNKGLTMLPDLSRFQNLKILNCFYNSLLELPENLPKSLQIIYCQFNSLSILPENLPQSLQELYCYENHLVKLPDNIPQNIQILDCSFNFQLQIKYPNVNFNNYNNNYNLTVDMREYIFKINMQMYYHKKVIDRMQLLNANGALLEHSARITGKPSLAILDKV